MGLILDTSVLIAAERRGDAVEEALLLVKAALGDQECALSAISIVELTHGIYRARIPAHRDRRRIFVEDV
jgi:predicted nucleic acid-binding protein